MHQPRMATAIGPEVIFTTASATMPSVAGYRAIGSRRALTFGVWVAAGGPVTIIAADGPMPMAMLPTAVTSSGVGNVIDV